MNVQHGGHYDDAIVALAHRDYETAGNLYARAAWRSLADPRSDRDPFESDAKGWVGQGLTQFVTSAVCYRVAGRAERARDRGREAAAVAADFRTVLDRPVQRACLRELVADAKTVGGLDGAAAAYEDAADAYREAGPSLEDPQDWATTPLLQAANTPIQQVARSTANGEIAIGWDDLHGSDPEAAGRFLARRAEVKSQRFPTLLERVVDDGFLAAPRGTTEYNNANHQCPACESTDVNWVADTVLCLRCSTPSDRQ